MRKDFNVYCCNNRAEGHRKDDCHILKRDIETFIHNGHLNMFVVLKRKMTRDPERERTSLPHSPPN